VLPCKDLSNVEDVLFERLRGRATETEEQVQMRVKNSKEEIDRYKAAKFFQHSVINDDLEWATKDLFKIIDTIYEEEIMEWKKAK
jgi:guanylate kinase